MIELLKLFKKVLFRIIGYVWIVATIIGIFYFVNHKDYLNALRLTSQAFAVVGFALYVARKIERRGHEGFAIFLIFFGSFLFSVSALQSLGVVQIKDIVEVRTFDALKEIIDFKTAAYEIIPVFLMVSGAFLTIAYLCYVSVFRNRCNYEVLAICNDLKERRFNGPYKCPIYEISFNGTTYFLSNDIFINKKIPKIGEKVRIKINYDDPTEFRLVKNDPHESGGLMAFGIAFFVFGLVFSYMAKKNNIV